MFIIHLCTHPSVISGFNSLVVCNSGINTKITLSLMHKELGARVHTLFYNRFRLEHLLMIFVSMQWHPWSFTFGILTYYIHYSLWSPQPHLSFQCVKAPSKYEPVCIVILVGPWDIRFNLLLWSTLICGLTSLFTNKQILAAFTLTHKAWTIFKITFSNKICWKAIERQILYFHSNFTKVTKVCSWRSNWQYWFR